MTTPVYVPRKFAIQYVPSTFAYFISNTVSGVTDFIHNITLHNTNTVDQTVEIHTHNGVNMFRLVKATLVPDETLILQWTNEGLIIPTNNHIGAVTGVANKMVISVEGSERTE